MTNILIHPLRLFQRYAATLTYIVTILVVNSLFVLLPPMTIFGFPITPGDMLVGTIYVTRDFAQREIKHYVIIAMVIGSILSYLLADKTVAVASICAFMVGESIDWAIYTFTRKPLSQRILWSSMVSAPIDSVVFLYFMNLLTPADFGLITISKFLGIAVLWYLWRIKSAPRLHATFQQASPLIDLDETRSAES